MQDKQIFRRTTYNY